MVNQPEPDQVGRNVRLNSGLHKNFKVTVQAVVNRPDDIYDGPGVVRGRRIRTRLLLWLRVLPRVSLGVADGSTQDVTVLAVPDPA